MRNERMRKFYEENRQGLYIYALSLSGLADVAEDAVHNAILRMLKRPLLPRSIKPYAYKCVRNAVVDYWRKKEAKFDHNAEFDSIVANNPNNNGYVDIEKMMKLLSHDEEEVIILKTILGLTFREIATIVNVSANTVASRYRRGLEKLKKVFEEKSHEKY